MTTPHTTYEALMGGLEPSNRMHIECDTHELGERCGWDRETMIDACMHEDSPSAWLGRKVFETSFDDGSMRYMSGWYYRFARENGHFLPCTCAMTDMCGTLYDGDCPRHSR